MTTYKKIIVANRGEGKTEEAINLAAKTGGVIVCATEVEALLVRQRAKRAGVSILSPISMHELARHSRGRKCTYIIDNVLHCFCRLLGVDYGCIEAATITSGETCHDKIFSS